MSYFIGLKHQRHIYDDIAGNSSCKCRIQANKWHYTDWQGVSLNLLFKLLPTVCNKLMCPTSRQDFPVVSNQPLNVISYGPEIVPCNSQFDANVSSPFNCTSCAQVWWRGNTPSATSIMIAPMIAMVLFLISLVI